MSTYVVTGGCGFIGSYVIKELLKSDDKELFIYNIDNKTGKNWQTREKTKDKNCETC